MFTRHIHEATHIFPTAWILLNHFSVLHKNTQTHRHRLTGTDTHTHSQTED